MRKPKAEKRRDKARLFKFAVCVFVVYVVYMLVQQQFDIKDKQLELTMLEQQIEAQRLENKEIARLLESDNDAYIERIAKDEYGYAYPDEKVFIDQSGS